MSDEGCSCHICPPCVWCMSLTEEEVIIYEDGGHDAVLKHRREKEEESE